MGCAVSEENPQNVDIPSKRYQDKQLLGQGGLGKVYRVIDNANQKEYARKIIENFNQFDENSQQGKKICSKLKNLRHKNILSCQNISVTNNKLSLLMQYSKKGNLQQKMSLRSRLDQDIISVITKQILQGLHQLHSQNIIHNNLKPSNVLLFDNSVIKISDFFVQSFSKKNKIEQNGHDNFSWKNFPFTAPEDVKNIGTFPVSDIWSVGCLVIYMLQGRYPWQQLGQNKQKFEEITKAEVPPLPFGISVACQTFLQECLQIVHSQRSNTEQLLKHQFILKSSKKQEEAKQNIKKRNSRYEQKSNESKKDINQKDIRIKTSKKEPLSLFSQKIVLDDNIITVGQDEVRQKLSSYHPLQMSTPRQKSHFVMINNKEVKLNPSQYRSKQYNVLQTQESQWISPSRVKMKTFKSTTQNNFDDFLRNKTLDDRNNTTFQRYPEHNKISTKKLRVQTEPNQYIERQYFKKPLKLIKRKAQQKRRLSLKSRKLSGNEQLNEIFQQQNKLPQESQLSRVNSKSNHEQIVINTQIARAQRYKYTQVQRMTKRKKQEEKMKWQEELNKGRQYLRDQSLYLYNIK